MNNNQWQTPATDLALITTAISEMGNKTDSEARKEILAWMNQISGGAPTAQLAQDAANAIRQLPQPASMPPEQAARYDHYIQLLGGKTPQQELAAALRAHEWLQKISEELS